MEKGNHWQAVFEQSLNFKANDAKLKFDNKDNLGNANDNYSGGLLFVGLCLTSKELLLRGSLFIGANVASRQAFCRFPEYISATQDIFCYLAP